MIRKYVIVILCLLYSVFTQSQEVGLWIDGRNAVFGSSVNPPKLNWKISISDYYNGTYTRLGTEYEAFNYLGYQQWTWMKIDQEIPITDKLSALVGMAVSQIYHETSYSNDAMSYAFNLEVNYKLNDWLKVAIQLNKQRATDIEQLWRHQAYVGLKYYWGNY